MKKSVCRGLMATVAIALFGWVASARAAPVTTLIEPAASIDYGHTEGTAHLTLKVDGLDPKAMGQADLVGDATDIDKQDPTSVEIDSKKKELQHGVTSRFWLLTLKVNSLPANSSRPRYLTVPVAGADVTLAYTLTNMVAGKFAWQIKSAPIVTVGPGGDIPVSVFMGPVPASNVRVVQSALTDKNSHKLIAPTLLILCHRKQAPCTGDGLDLKSSEELVLRGTADPGRYVGNVVIAALEKPEGETVPFTVNVTSMSYQMGGVFTIFLGVTLSWFITIYIRGRINRDQLMLPVAAINKILTPVCDVLENMPVGYKAPKIAAQLKAIRAALSQEKLECAGLPNKVPMPWSDGSSTASVEQYKAYVQSQSDWATALKILALNGLALVERKVPQNPDSNQKAALDTAFAEIDALIEGVLPPTPASLQGQLPLILARLDGALAGAGVVPRSLGVPSIPTTDQLVVEITRLAILAWIFIALVTVLSGAYILIFTESAAGFGTPLDFLTCLIWGLGLSAGSQLMQATTGSIRSSFGVTR